MRLDCRSIFVRTLPRLALGQAPMHRSEKPWLDVKTGHRKVARSQSRIKNGMSSCPEEPTVQVDCSATRATGLAILAASNAMTSKVPVGLPSRDR